MKFTSEITVKEIQHMGSDMAIAAAAWVSTSAEAGYQRAVDKPDDVKGVINYLVKNRHGTPFEHGAITLYVHAPIFVWREWHRHRIGFSYNEESARYKTLEPVFYLPAEDRPMIKVDNWKPGKPKFITIAEALEEDAKRHPIEQMMNVDTYDTLVNNLKDDYTRSYGHYLENLAIGIDPGLARDGLNVGIYSSCWVTANPRSLMAFLSLRHHEPTATFPSYPLYEIDQAAQQVEEIFKDRWPITHAAFVANGRVAP